MDNSTTDACMSTAGMLMPVAGEASGRTTPSEKSKGTKPSGRLGPEDGSNPE